MDFLFRWCRMFAIVIASLTCLSLNTAASEQDPDLTYMTLSGLRSLAIRIEGIQKDFTRFGLDADTVLKVTTGVLRGSGIEVVALDTLKTAPAAALMRVKLNANESQFRFYSYALSIELKQKIPLNNPAGGFISGTIWKRGKTGTIMPTDLRRMNEYIAELVAEFIKDYQAQNPPRVSIAR
jgi:hypothetical protein